jgi:hypothetical protein
MIGLVTSPFRFSVPIFANVSNCCFGHVTDDQGRVDAIGPLRSGREGSLLRHGLKLTLQHNLKRGPDHPMGAATVIRT